MDNTQILDGLRQCEAYGRAVLQNLDLLKQVSEFPPEFDIPTLKQRLQKAAQKTVDRASAAVKIGIMGEFSSGKTLLLGSLIGYADLLPISENPTTGNVTAIHLSSRHDLQTTRISNSKVKYLSYEGAKDCLIYMLDQALERSRQVSLPSTHLNGLTHLDRQDPNIWDAVLSWTQTAWNASQNIELRYLLQELVIFTRTYLAYGAAVCGRQYQVDADTVREGLQLSEFPLTQIMAFTEIAFEPPHVSPPLASVSDQDLKNSFALIERLDISIEVSQQIWDLSALQGSNEVMLLDFPGLGAANSRVRDTFLSLKELGEVQTVLVLLNAKVPGGDRANQIFTMMQKQYPEEDIKDRIIVGIGRFDELPLDDEEILDGLIRKDETVLSALSQESDFFEEDIIDSLFKDEAEAQGGDDTQPEKKATLALKEEVVLEQLKVLKTLIHSGQAFTTDAKRLLFLSPLLGIADLAKQKPHNVQVGSLEFMAKLDYPDGPLVKAKKVRDKWQQLGDLLLESDPTELLGQRLQAFARDGGILSLQNLLRDHVSRHGLEQLYLSTRVAAKALQAEQSKLQAVFSNLDQGDLPFVDENRVKRLTESIQNIIKTYRDFQENLAISPFENEVGQPISEVIKDEISFKIYGWDLWNRLFNVTRNGIITDGNASENVDPILVEVFGESSMTAVKIPTRSADFYPDFETTIQDLGKSILTLVRQAVELQLQTLSDGLAQDWEVLQTMLHPEVAQKIQRHFSDTQPLYFQYFRLLLSAKDPAKQWLTPVLKQSGILEQELEVFPSGCFPLVRENVDNTTPNRIFDWGKQPAPTPYPANHQILVLRLRSELIRSAEFYLVEELSRVTKQVKQKLFVLLNNLIPKLENLVRQDSLLRVMAADQKEREIPAGFEILSQIVSIAPPESL